jgi:hypothetical protein
LVGLIEETENSVDIQLQQRRLKYPEKRQSTSCSDSDSKAGARFFNSLFFHFYFYIPFRKIAEANQNARNARQNWQFNNQSKAMQKSVGSAIME